MCVVEWLTVGTGCVYPHTRPYIKQCHLYIVLDKAFYLSLSESRLLVKYYMVRKLWKAKMDTVRDIEQCNRIADMLRSIKSSFYRFTGAARREWELLELASNNYSCIQCTSVSILANKCILRHCTSAIDMRHWLQWLYKTVSYRFLCQVLFIIGHILFVWFLRYRKLTHYIWQYVCIIE